MLDLSKQYLVQITNNANQIEDHIATPISYNDTTGIYCISASGIGRVLFVEDDALSDDTTAGELDIIDSYYIDIEDKTYLCKIVYYNESTSLFCVSPAGIGTVIFAEKDDLTEIS